MPKMSLESLKKKKVSFDHQLNGQTLSGRERAEEGAEEAAGDSSFNTLESSTRPMLSRTVLNKASQTYKDLSSAEAHARSPCLFTGI